MSESVRVAWDETLTRYNFGPGHPLSPVRLDLTMRLARSLGVLDYPHVTVAASPPAADDVLRSVHGSGYIEAVRRCGADAARVEPGVGLGSGDNPAFPGMHEASAAVVGGTVDMTRGVLEGRFQHGVNIAGGLHHAMPGYASGFCVYNDVAVGIRWLLEAGVERIGYVDVDVHHGDGVQAIFYDDPRVLTISLHETDRTLFPGTGHPEESGGSRAPGSAVNVALPPGTDDAGWLRAFYAVVPPLLRAYGPQVLVTQHGCDSHVDDPLAHLALTLDGQRTSYAALHALAHELCGGRWVATGGGGYAVVDVVPRAWTHLIAEAAGRPLEPYTALPTRWRQDVWSRHHRSTPGLMTDGAPATYTAWAEGFDPADALDRAVLATKTAVFPSHGLDPLR